MMLDPLDRLIDSLAGLFPPGSFLADPWDLRTVLAIILVSINCGLVGSLVVGNRMAFFSDALAHCAFAGVALAMLSAYVIDAFAVRGGTHSPVLNNAAFWEVAVPLIMVAFGILVGLGIALVREHSGLTSDTVIGVFFAGAVGLGGMLIKTLSNRRYLSPELFMFGEVSSISTTDLFLLLLLTITTSLVLAFLYNSLLLTSFNSSLARSRNVSVRLCNYVFIVLLALIINLCLKSVGVLLINAFLIVPAATAANVCRNLRQQFWVTTSICLVVGTVGRWLSLTVTMPDVTGSGKPIEFGTGGTIVVLSVVLFFVSMLLGPRLRGSRPPG